MNLLAIETSSHLLGVALADEQRVLASYELLAERAHAAELPGALTRVLRAAGVTLEQVEGIAIDIGPGSFTGLRIGAAFVKALAFCLKKPVVGVPSLDVLAANLLFAPHLVCPIVDAKQKKVYACCYRTSDGRLAKESDYHLLTVEDLAPMLKDGPVLFLGDGIPLYRERLMQALGERAIFSAPDLWLPRAATLARLGLERLAKGQHDDPSGLVPMYLHPMTCTVRQSDRPHGAPRQSPQPA